MRAREHGIAIGDGGLNDITRFHVRAERVRKASAGGAVPEDAVGSGMGMIWDGFTGGIGTASRVCPGAEGGFGGKRPCEAMAA